MTTTPDDAARVFAQERRRLLGVAYRLTSSWADAEDVVADVWPRFAAHADEIRSPAAWLTTVVSRAALDLPFDQVAQVLDVSVEAARQHAGRVTAAGRRLDGAEEVARFLAGLARIAEWDLVSFRAVPVNGQAGFVVHNGSSKPRAAAVGVYAFTVHDGVVQAVHAVLAPDKVERYRELDAG